MKGFRLRRNVAVIMLAIFMLGTHCHAAAESAVSITDIDIDDTIVTVTGVYRGETTGEVTMTAIKSDDSLWEYDNYYAILQCVAEKDEQLVFDFLIPAFKNGVSSTGEYTVYISAGAGDTVSDTFRYITKEDLESFVDDIKTANETVSGADEAALKESAAKKLLPFFADEYKVELLNLGIDYDSFKLVADDVKEDTMYFMHKDDLSEANASTLATIFAKAYEISIYNSGEKVQALKNYNSAYTDSEITEMLKLMEDSYSSVEDFQNACDTAYSLIDINNARVDNLLSKLDSFPENEDVADAASKIKALNSTKQVNACEYFVAEADKNPIKTISELVELLDDAYDKATATQSNDSGRGNDGRSPTTAGTVPQKYEVATEVQPAEPNNSVDVPSAEFTDVSTSHWAYSCIKWLYNEGVVNGDGSGRYLPEKAVTREEFIKMIILAADVAAQDTAVSFDDVESGAWYEDYISAAVSQGITNGISDEEFGVGDNITRQDMVTMAARALKAVGKELKPVRDYTRFTDEGDISEYASESVKNMYSAGIINGFEEGSFAPKAQATRAEVAKIIYEMFKEVK